MLALVYLLVVSLAGFAVVTRLLPTIPAIVRIPAGFLLAVVFTSWTTYLIAAGFSGATDNSLKIGLIVSTVLGGVVLALFGRSLRPRHLRLSIPDLLVTAPAIALSTWLTHMRLREENGELLVSSNTWADHGLHIALARSFSVGGNYPAQYPFFAGEPIRYHFGFDFFAGMLQEGGLSVLWSFNLPAIIGFTAMMVLSFALARLLFGPAERVRWWRDQGVWAGFIAATLVVTNQSLGWKRFVEDDAKGSITAAFDPQLLWNHETYLAQGPYEDDRIAMFNTLNAYLTQTHLIVACAVVLLLAYVLIWLLKDGARLDRRLLLALSITFGVSFWLNGVVWLATAVFLGMTLVIWALAAARRARKGLPEPADETAAVRADAVVAADATPADAAVHPTEPTTTAPATASDAPAASGDERPASPDAAPEPDRDAKATLVTWAKILAIFAIPALLLGVPQAIMLNGGGTSGGLKIHVGYLVCGWSKASCNAPGGGQMDLLSLADWWTFVQYWVLNEGAFIPLLILAFLLGTSRHRRIIAATTFIFVWGSLVQVGQDLGGQNHKVFNLWENLAGPFVGFAVVEIWMLGGRLLKRRESRVRRFSSFSARATAVGLVLFLTVTGLIDFMTIKNDFRVDVFGNLPTRQATAWIVKETPKKSTFVTDYDQLYTAPTMAGRGIALGFSSWASSAGYDIEPRKAMITAIYTSPDRASLCSRLKASGMDYVIVGQQERDSPRFEVNEAVFQQLTPAAAFGEGDERITIYPIAGNC